MPGRDFFGVEFRPFSFERILDEVDQRECKVGTTPYGTEQQWLQVSDHDVTFQLKT